MAAWLTPIVDAPAPTWIDDPVQQNLIKPLNKTQLISVLSQKSDFCEDYVLQMHISSIIAIPAWKVFVDGLWADPDQALTKLKSPENLKKLYEFLIQTDILKRPFGIAGIDRSTKTHADYCQLLIAEIKKPLGWAMYLRDKKTVNPAWIPWAAWVAVAWAMAWPSESVSQNRITLPAWKELPASCVWKKLDTLNSAQEKDLFMALCGNNLISQKLYSTYFEKYPKSFCRVYGLIQTENPKAWILNGDNGWKTAAMWCLQINGVSEKWWTVIQRTITKYLRCFDASLQDLWMTSDQKIYMTSSVATMNAELQKNPRFTQDVSQAYNPYLSDILAWVWHLHERAWTAWIEPYLQNLSNKTGNNLYAYVDTAIQWRNPTWNNLQKPLESILA